MKFLLVRFTRNIYNHLVLNALFIDAKYEEEALFVDRLEQHVKNEIDLRVEILKEQLEKARLDLFSKVHQEFNGYRK